MELDGEPEARGCVETDTEWYGLLEKYDALSQQGKRTNSVQIMHTGMK